MPPSRKHYYTVLLDRSSRAVFLVGVFPSAKLPEKWDLGIQYPLYTEKVPRETFSDTPGKKDRLRGRSFWLEFFRQQSRRENGIWGSNTSYIKIVPEETFFDTPGKKTACEGGLFGCRNWCVPFLDRKGR